MTERPRYRWMAVGWRIALLTLLWWWLVSRFRVHEVRWRPEWWLGVLWAQPFYLAGLIAFGWRHAWFVRRPPASLRIATKAVLLSLGLNLVLPGRLAELVRATYLRDHAQVPLAEGLAGVVFERVLDLIFIALVGLMALSSGRDARWSYIVALALGIVFVGAAPFWLRLVRWALPWLPWEPLRAFVSRFLDHLERQRSARGFYRAVVAGVLAWSLGILGFGIVLGTALRWRIGWSQILGAYVATTLGGAIPALPGGFGTYEGAAALALDRLAGVPIPEGLALGLLLHLSSLLIPLVATVWILAREHLGLWSLVREARAAVRGEERA